MDAQISAAISQGLLHGPREASFVAHVARDVSHLHEFRSTNCLGNCSGLGER